MIGLRLACLLESWVGKHFFLKCSVEKPWKETLSAVDSEEQNKKAREQIEGEIKGAEGDVTTEKKRCFMGIILG